MLYLKIIALAILFVITGGQFFSDNFRKHKVLFTAALCVALLSSYYLGESIYNDLYNGGLDNNNNAPKSSKLTEPYLTNIPDEMAYGDRWGRFHINGNCTLTFGNSAIHTFEGFSNNSGYYCEYSPKFSPSPSGKYVLVYSPLNDTLLRNFATVDTERGQVIRASKRLSEDNVAFFYDTWSTDETNVFMGELFISEPYIKSRYGKSAYVSGQIPCIYNIVNDELSCPSKKEVFSHIINFIKNSNTKNKCLVSQSCFVEFGINNAIWVDKNSTFEARYGANVSTIDNPSSDEIISTVEFRVSVNTKGKIISVKEY